MWNILVTFLSGPHHSTGGVERDCAIDKLERGGYEEGGRKRSGWHGVEEMGTLK